MRRRFVSALLILALGFLPGVPAVACPSGRTEASDSHTHADDSVRQRGHHHSAEAALHGDAPEPAANVNLGSPPEQPAEHSAPDCCRGTTQPAVTAVWEGIRVRSSDALPALAPVALIGIERHPTLSSRDPRALRPDERRSPYVRTRAPLLI
jgi:hypothetical protein